jgi:multimeric flavodoxin WrbA
MNQETGLPKLLIVYYSKTGHTKKMAEAIAEGAKEFGQVEVILKSVEDATNQNLLKADCIILGSPTYFRLPAWPMKKFIDESIEVYEKLHAKKGAVFSSAGDEDSGAYCIEALKNALEEHGIEIIGDGLLIEEEPTEEEIEKCKGFGAKIAEQL